MDLFKDFKQFKAVDEELLAKFTGKLPGELLDIWKEHGFGSFNNGFLKIINPDDFQEILNETYHSAENSGAIPVMATGMGDLIILGDDGYVNVVAYRFGLSEIISAEFEDFLELLSDEEESVYNVELDRNPYPEALEKLGEPDYDECFSYVPLLGLGGTANVENLQRVKLKEYIMLVKELIGTVEDAADSMIICQSCAVGLSNGDDFGTNTDGSINNDYCSRCYKDGKFTYDLTVDALIAFNLSAMMEANKDITEETAREVLREGFSCLKRWKALA